MRNEDKSSTILTLCPSSASSSTCAPITADFSVALLALPLMYANIHTADRDVIIGST